jgi:hypothetical protein
MIPPGVPDFPTRRRTLTTEPTLLRGRAWSGWGPIGRVEVSTDGGQSWAPAELEQDVDSWAWCAWSFRFEPEGAGEYVLCCRAADSAGNEQPSDPAWNVGGYANNAVQRVPVTVA